MGVFNEVTTNVGSHIKGYHDHQTNREELTVIPYPRDELRDHRAIYAYLD